MSEPKDVMVMGSTGMKKSSKKSSKKKSSSTFEEQPPWIAPALDRHEDLLLNPQHLSSSTTISRAEPKAQQRVAQENSLMTKASKKKTHPVEEEEEAPEEDDEDDNAYDDDDFENYDDDDDFEPEENELAQAQANDLSVLQQALQDENRVAQQQQQPKARSRVMTTTTTSSKTKTKTTNRPSISSSISRALDPRQRRVLDLRTLCPMSSESFEMFHQFPSTEFELYTRRLRSNQSKQVLTQTNDDARAMTCQTDEVEVRDQAAQVPATDNEESSEAAMSSSNSVTLARFLHQAAQICEVLLIENLSQNTGTKSKLYSPQAPQDHQYDSHSFQKPSFFSMAPDRENDGQWKCIHLCPSPRIAHLVLAAYQSARVDHHSISRLALWDVHDPSQPLRTFRHQGLISCCLLDPSSQCIVAGTMEGGVLLWDLSLSRDTPVQSSDDHHHQTSASSTFCQLSHQAPICALDWISSGPSSSPSSIVSMDNRNVITIWTVVRRSVQQNDDDLPQDHDSLGEGLVPHEQQASSFQLIRRSSMNGSPSLSQLSRDTLNRSSDIDNDDHDHHPSSEFPGPVIQLAFPFQPTVASSTTLYFILGTTHGSLVRMLYSSSTKTKTKTSTKIFQYDTPNNIPCSDELVTLEVNPIDRAYFLAGWTSGHICVYHWTLGAPVKTWNTRELDDFFSFSAPLRSCCWSQHRADVVFAVDDQHIYIFDGSSSETNHAVQSVALDSTSESSGSSGPQALYCTASEISTTLPSLVVSSTSAFQVMPFDIASSPHLSQFSNTVGFNTF